MKMDPAQNSPISTNGIDDIPNDPGKMFIGGLSWQTTAETLKSHFGVYGEIKEAMVMKDPTTKRSRGFGFVTFQNPDDVDKVLKACPHELDNKVVDPKVAFPRKAQPKMVTRTKKIFVGGLSASTTVEDVKNFFSGFGKIEDAMLMFDKQTMRHRGFFLTHALEDRIKRIVDMVVNKLFKKIPDYKREGSSFLILLSFQHNCKSKLVKNDYFVIFIKLVISKVSKAEKVMPIICKCSSNNVSYDYANLYSYVLKKKVKLTKHEKKNVLEKLHFLKNG
ncbi:RNA-binding protein Musashi, partial [Mytilus galloprovincialis]